MAQRRMDAARPWWPGGWREPSLRRELRRRQRADRVQRRDATLHDDFRLHDLSMRVRRQVRGDRGLALFLDRHEPRGPGLDAPAADRELDLPAAPATPGRMDHGRRISLLR